MNEPKGSEIRVGSEASAAAWRAEAERLHAEMAPLEKELGRLHMLELWSKEARKHEHFRGVSETEELWKPRVDALTRALADAKEEARHWEEVADGLAHQVANLVAAQSRGAA